MAKAPASPRKPPAKAAKPKAGTGTPEKAAKPASKQWRVAASTPDEVATRIDAKLGERLGNAKVAKERKKAARINKDTGSATQKAEEVSPKRASSTKSTPPIVKSEPKEHEDAPLAPLNAKQQRFVDEYLTDLNATQAAIRAGYSEKTARFIASENLAKPNIAAAIQAGRDKTANKLEITRERVMREYARLAFVDPRDFYNADGTLKNVPDMDADTAAALVGFEVDELFAGSGADAIEIGQTKKIKWSDKKAALDSINRMMGWNQDKLKVQGDPEAPLEVRTKVVIVPPKQVAEVLSRAFKAEENQ